ncbi:unnamed protein product [Ilex paraguariensis]|uniref:ubiquitinyl hydrolase 1 n=1 Tax=Ilex paraguariensis TaxID=185542 RepID=A0ABC8V3C2_9AQUA
MVAEPKEARAGIKVVYFLLFNPTDNKTTLAYADRTGKMYRESKGAPEQILNLAHNKSEIEWRIYCIIDRCGFHFLAVACQEVSTGNKDSTAELCTARHGREVSSPQKVMFAMTHYNPNFNLTNQQDAEEAFFHILSSLREELAECYATNHGSLAEVAAFPNCRILTPTRSVHQGEQQRWQRAFIGPFDGILGSILTCQSCSFQISLDFQFFHSLHLSPMLSSGATIVAGCSVEDCLKQFFVAEKLENYCCSHCWHTAAIKYLSLLDESETDIEQINSCIEQSSCGCKNLSRLGALPWSDRFSRTFKQLSIARSPKILCIHLQRAAINLFGELVKLQGHISFPLILNLSPFMKGGVGIKNWEEKFPSGQSKQQFQPLPYSNHLSMKLDTRMLKGICEQMGKKTSFEAVVAAEFRQTAIESLGSTCGQVFQGEPALLDTGGCSDTTLYGMPMQSGDKVGMTCHLAPSDHPTYRLVSVVQHYGRAGSGHYTVYRKVGAKLNDKDPGGPSESTLMRWFCISDSEVYSVSEEDVLAAEASVLFYEKIQEG